MRGKVGRWRSLSAACSAWGDMGRYGLLRLAPLALLARAQRRGLLCGEARGGNQRTWRVAGGGKAAGLLSVVAEAPKVILHRALQRLHHLGRLGNGRGGGEVTRGQRVRVGRERWVGWQRGGGRLRGGGGFGLGKAAALQLRVDSPAAHHRLPALAAAVVAAAAAALARALQRERVPDLKRPQARRAAVVRIRVWLEGAAELPPIGG